MNPIEQIEHLLPHCSPDERERLFRQLRAECTIHPLERQLHTKAEIVLEAIQRAGGLTLRMIRGVIAEAAFGVEVVERLVGWNAVAKQGDLAYDFLLEDFVGRVRVQVKLQRSKAGSPMLASEANKRFSSEMYVVETQKTRKGEKRAPKTRLKKPRAVARAVRPTSTRPYRFGEFDLLAVAMYPSTSRWDTFMYTVADWLLPNQTDRKEILKFQPVAKDPNDDWTADFQSAVAWLRSRKQRTIRST